LGEPQSCFLTKLEHLTKLERKTAKAMETIVAGIIFALMVVWIFQDASNGK
jgi:hypothetical protein